MRRRLLAAVLVSLVVAQSHRVSAIPSREILTASVYIEAAYDAVWEKFRPGNVLAGRSQVPHV